MPSREEIVEWLREAALIADYAVIMNSLNPSGVPVKKSVFHERAAQVESMRCETCAHRYYTSSCSKYNQHILGLKDGCFSHEQKPAG